MGVTVPFVYAQFRRARSGVETTGRGHIHDDDDDEDANAAGRYSNRPRNSAPATTTARRARSVFRKSCFARERLDLDEDESDDEVSRTPGSVSSAPGRMGSARRRRRHPRGRRPGATRLSKWTSTNRKCPGIPPPL